MLKLRLIALAVVCMSLAAVVASAEPLPIPREEDPLKQVFLASSRVAKLPTKCGPYCDLTSGGTTPTATAIGSTCTIAQSNLTTQLRNYANSFCGTGGCNLVVHTTVACHADAGGFSVSGYATFGCRDSTC
jgi:hypothetical protein